MDISIDEFCRLSESDKCKYIQNFSILYAQQFSRQDLDDYCFLSDACRAIHKTAKGATILAGLLPHCMVLNFFVQPSSRTFLSFGAAEAILGMKRMSLRDVRISSMSKGESLQDSLRTFISYVDLVVMRHGDEKASDVAFWISMQSHRTIDCNGTEHPIPIISGGSGSKQHPTQALLDIYTLEKSFEDIGGIDGKTLMLVGDLKRGRTVRSLSYLMRNYQDITLLFAAPAKYQMEADILEFLDGHNITYRMIDSIAEGIEETDAVYMTRIQDEWDDPAADNKAKDANGHVTAHKDFVFRAEHLSQMKETAYLLHPLPKRDEVEAAIDFIDDPRIVYWRQERNGMWMRVAIIAKLFGVDAPIRAAYGV